MEEKAMTQTAENLSLEELKSQLRRLNSKAGQMKMDLHDLAEGLPANYEQLPTVAGQTYEIFHQIDCLKKKIAELERTP
jgi:hypothetical protein